MATPEACRGRSAGYARQPLIHRPPGSVRMGFGACQLAPEGHITGHMHSYEGAFSVLEGHPRLSMGGETVEPAPHHCGLISVGVSHA